MKLRFGSLLLALTASLHTPKTPTEVSLEVTGIVPGWGVGFIYLSAATTNESKFWLQQIESCSLLAL